MKIFVTGASGFLGAELLSQILARSDANLEILVLAREPLENRDPRICYLLGDLRHIERFSSELKSCHFVYHLAAKATYGSGSDYALVNVDPVKKMVETLRSSQNLRNFVFVSTIGAMDRGPQDQCTKPLSTSDSCFPQSDYGRSKLEAEIVLHQSAIPHTIIRPTWVFGPRMRAKSHINQFVTMVAKKNFIARFNFPGRVSTIHVTDLAKALAKIPDSEKYVGRTYIAETGASSIGEIFRIISHALSGRKVQQMPVPPLRYIIARIHKYLPLSLNNLFLDYLFASDPTFTKDFGIENPIRLELGIKDVIESNVEMNGAIIITGANSGIGLALTRRLDKAGHNLILVDKELDQLIQFKRHELFQIDLSSESAIRELSTNIRKRSIRCLINNAGIGFRRSLDQITRDELFATIRVNVLAPCLLVKELLPNLKRDGSTIVNIASSVAYNPLPNMSIYAASKAFVSSLSEALAYELKGTNQVITVSPSGTSTGFQKRAGVPVNSASGELLSPDYVAARIARLLSSRSRVVVLGFKTKLLLLISRVLPRRLNVKMWGVLFEQLR